MLVGWDNNIQYTYTAIKVLIPRGKDAPRSVVYISARVVSFLE